MRDRRLEAHLLALLREARTLEDLHLQLQPLHPGLRKATLFALLVRLGREGRVVFHQGRFKIAP
ncbi:hypothetical protein [Thermus albus]|uniref:hypothetical protein n=1 Tax=Thermus albus TaxID=2908146 RepID=UPI003C12C0C4